MLSATLHDIDGTHLGGIPSLMGATVQESLDDLGGGSVTVHVDNALASSLTYRRWIKIWDRGQAVGGFIIAKRERTIVGEGAKAAEVLTVSGPGLLAWLKDAIVYQTSQTPYSRNARWFSWASEAGDWYNAEQWGVPANVRKRGAPDLTDSSNPWNLRPVNWPDCDPQAWWIWDRSNADEPAPKGDVYFRTTFSVSADGTPHRLWFTADNVCSVFIDGENIGVLEDVWSWLQTFTVDVVLNQGTHVLAVRARNLHGPAGFLAVMSVNDEANDDYAQVVTTGSGTWHCLAYPTSEPGWSPGEILSTLHTEAVARGVTSASRYTLDFTSLLDTGSNSWTNYPVKADVGSTYWDVANQLRDIGCDLRLNPNTMKLQAWASRGSTKSVVVNGQAHASTLDESVENATANVLLISSGEQWASARKATSVTSYGRIEAFLDVSAVSALEASKVAEATLDIAGTPQESVTVEYTPVSGNVPWVDFNVGDTIFVSTVGGAHTTRRVKSLSAGMDENGRTVYAVELGALSRDRIDQLQRIIDRAGADRGPQAQAVSRYADADYPPGGGLPESEWPDGGDDAWSFDDGLGEGWFDWPNPSVATEVIPDSRPGVDSEESWSVGAVDGAVSLNPSDYWGVEDLTVALCSSAPTSSSGGWPSLATFELTSGTATGYARATLDSTAVGAASYSSGSENRVSTADITFNPNSGGTSWPTVTHIALCAASDGKVLSVVPLGTPLVIGPSEAATIAAGDLVFAHACAGA